MAAVRSVLYKEFLVPLESRLRGGRAAGPGQDLAGELLGAVGLGSSRLGKGKV